jgi:hypothetical protein
MADGVRTRDEIRVQFAEEFLLSGNAAATSRKIGIPVRTGNDIARSLEADAEFAKARHELLTHALDRGKTMALGLLETTAARAKKRPRELPVGEGGLMIHDKGPDYARAFADIYRAVLQHGKLDDERRARSSGVNAEGGPVEVVIRVTGEAKAESEAVSALDVSSG